MSSGILLLHLSISIATAATENTVKQLFCSSADCPLGRCCSHFKLDLLKLSSFMVVRGNEGPLCSYFCRQSWLNTKANFIRATCAWKGYDLSLVSHTFASHPHSGQRVCVCVIFTFLHMLAQMCTSRRCPLLAKLSRLCRFPLCQSPWLVFGIPLQF